MFSKGSPHKKAPNTYSDEGDLGLVGEAFVGSLQLLGLLKHRHEEIHNLTWLKS